MRKTKDLKDVKNPKDFQQGQPRTPRRLRLSASVLSFASFSSFRSLLSVLCLLPLTACSPAPAAVPEDTPAIPVRLETTARTTFQPTLAVLGVVRPGETAEVAVTAGGRLRYPARFADGLATGAEVRAGEVLARISLQDAEASLAESRLHLRVAESELARHRKAFEAGVEAAVVLAAAEAEAELARSRVTAAEGRLSRLDLRAPVSGRLIVERRVPPESEVAAGVVLARIAAGGSPEVDARAAAADRDLLRPGLLVRFVAPGGREPLGEGEIREISPVVEAAGTVPLVVRVRDAAGLPAPGEGVELRIELDARPETVTVPEDALVAGESGNAVFVMQRGRGRGVARRTQVETGARGNGRVEILRGLSAGDRVVVGGASMLSDGDLVTAVEPEAAK
jgi:membrane fusion protein (multidrug efflux system)